MRDKIKEAIKKGKQKREAYKDLQKQRKPNAQETEYHTKNYFNGKYGTLFKPKHDLQPPNMNEYTPNNNIMPKPR